MTKSIKEFAEAHDPTYKTEYVGETYHRKIDWASTSRAIVVSAQNATPEHKEFWPILEYMAEALNAQLLVIPLRYKNATSLWMASQRNAEWWSPAVRPYLWNMEEDLNKNVTVLGDIKIQPTASNPLAGAEALSRASSAIVGHTRAQTRSVATPQHTMAKLLMTSGACTLSNYSDTRVGRLADFHHSLSAVLVELKGTHFYMRRLNYSDRTHRVIDQGIAYYSDRHETAPPSLALVMGDTHVDYVDPKVIEATFGANGLVERTRPKHLVWHDLLDGHSCNPHHANNPFADIAKYYAGRSEVNGETQRAIEFVHEHTQRAIETTKQEDVLSVIVPSNHIDFLARYIMKEDWKKLPAENRRFYLKTALMMAENTALTEKGINFPDPFTEIFRAANVPNVRLLDLDEPFVLADVALHMHGDRGPNGARGSIKNIRRVATKSIIGHSHSPGEDEGCTQVGTSTRLKLEYNAGASSWLNTHCDLNADGKRQLVTIVDGRSCL